ncbi:MAG: LysM peptidoglycan-binding domain-containing protein, partial [Patescibacteria group bacterium]
GIARASISFGLGGAITITGVSAGTAVITVHPSQLPASDTSKDKIITVTVTSTAGSNAASGAQGGNMSGGTGGSGAGAGGGSGGGSGGGGTGGGSGGSGGATALSDTGGANQSAQTIAQLRSQIAELESRIANLNNRINSGGGGNSSDSAQIAALQNQITQLSNLVRSLQSGQVKTLGSVDGAPFKGLQMPAGYPASGGLQMPATTARVGGVATKGAYIVKKGDTLWAIAKKQYGDGKLWRKILEANPECLSKSGNTKTLKVGFELVIPE